MESGSSVIPRMQWSVRLIFIRSGFSAGVFDEMKVPQHIELAGYDKIHYINTMYPWEGHIYRRPAGTGKEKGKGSSSARQSIIR